MKKRKREKRQFARTVPRQPAYPDVRPYCHGADPVALAQPSCNDFSCNIEYIMISKHISKPIAEMARSMRCEITGSAVILGK
jgi:hypothetical protein